jgi:hypothetical protein
VCSEAPHSAQKPFLFSAPERSALIAGEHKDGKLLLPFLIFRLSFVAVRYPVGFVCLTQARYRALCAFRASRRKTDRRAKLHEALGKISGSVLRIVRQESCGDIFFHACGIVLPVKPGDPGDDPMNISVDSRGFLSEADGSNRSGRIRTDARQPDDLSVLVRENTAVFPEDDPGRVL